MVTGRWGDKGDGEVGKALKAREKVNGSTSSPTGKREKE
jgi:hypothetical protein